MPHPTMNDLHEKLLLVGVSVWHNGNYILESPLRNHGIPYNLTIVKNHIDLKGWTLHVSIAAPVTVMQTNVTLNDVTAVLYYANQFRRVDTNEKLTRFIENLETDNGYPETAGLRRPAVAHCQPDRQNRVNLHLRQEGQEGRGVGSVHAAGHVCRWRRRGQWAPGGEHLHLRAVETGLTATPALPQGESNKRPSPLRQSASR